MPNSYLNTLETAWKEHLLPRAPNAPTVISTFAGCGGSSLGYSMAGFNELLAVEKSDHAVASFSLNFPNVPVLHANINTISTRDVLRASGLAVGQLDLLDGSPPCQGFSSAGKRDATDPRNQLFLEYVRMLDGLKPKTFIMENVAGMVKGRMKSVFAQALRALKECGYNVSVRLLNTMYFGVPQSRERLIFIGLRHDLGHDLDQNPDKRPTHPGAQCHPISMQQAIGDLPKEQDPNRDHVWLDESPAGRNTRTWHLARRAQQGERYAGQQRRYHWGKPCGTLITPSSEAQDMPPYLRSIGCHPLYTRTLSLLEYKRIGSFPDAFLYAPPWRRAFIRIGNSVPPLFMRALATHVRQNFLATLQTPLEK